MGVPGYYKWLVQHCEAIQKKSMQVDNLYLDMNGILHPVCHSDGHSLETQSEEEMLSNFCLKLDEIISMTKPKKLIYLAFDGPAPNAKMVQQRSRRFCARRNMHTSARLYAKIAKEWKDQGLPVPEMPEMWDSNKITPGTPFMLKVRKTVESYISARISDEGWKAYHNVAWILSDSSEPGEGEHKLIQFIKKQRAGEDKDLSTTHCLVGNDADLIQLALSVHDPNISIWREDHFICINMVREYFRQCLKSILDDSSIPAKLKDFERLLDDLLLCFCFVGNDFLPALPQMKIASNAIGRCLSAYISELPQMGDFLTNAGDINPVTLGKFIDKLHHVLQTVADPTDDLVRWYERLEFNHMKNAQAARGHSGASEAAFWSAHSRRSELLLWSHTYKNYSNDVVCVSLPGWQDRYYAEHWPAEPDLQTTKNTVSREYLRGLQWVQHYYQRDCPDWAWHYPYDYGPTLDNFHPETCDLDCLTFVDEGQPLNPLQQLLIVVPREGAEDLLPRSFTDLMDSALKDYFPDRFPIDYSNCPPKWMTKAVLPHIDLQYVRTITAPSLRSLTGTAKKLSDRVYMRLFVHESHRIARDHAHEDPDNEFKTGAHTHGVEGSVCARQSKLTCRRLSAEAVRFRYTPSACKIRSSALSPSPQPPLKELVHARNSKNPLFTDKRREWVGMNGLAYPTWGMSIDSTGKFIGSAKAKSSKRSREKN
ncbi:5'-3' exoribonuclease [Perkinsela sp. CCAP 1560/4]|nr:5'-3' exoribonuclease [Perkinsela sp. CCAP 1560/4]|eukprot:KNH05934.1 5'-3' exoribonuclease [Perkinsela sp. CCAP 1560/4]